MWVGTHVVLSLLGEADTAYIRVRLSKQCGNYMPSGLNV
jgi:hypothetical protein